MSTRSISTPHYYVWEHNVVMDEPLEPELLWRNMNRNDYKLRQPTLRPHFLLPLEPWGHHYGYEPTPGWGLSTVGPDLFGLLHASVVDRKCNSWGWNIFQAINSLKQSSGYISLIVPFKLTEIQVVKAGILAFKITGFIFFSRTIWPSDNASHPKEGTQEFKNRHMVCRGINSPGLRWDMWQNLPNTQTLDSKTTSLCLTVAAPGSQWVQA